MAKIAETEFRIWIETKIIKIQAKVKTESKDSKKYNKMRKEMKHERIISGKKETDLSKITHLRISDYNHEY